MNINVPAPLRPMPRAYVLDQIWRLLAGDDGHLRIDLVIVHVLLTLRANAFCTLVDLVLQLALHLFRVALAIRHGYQTKFGRERVCCLLEHPSLLLGDVALVHTLAAAVDAGCEGGQDEFSDLVRTFPIVW